MVPRTILRTACCGAIACTLFGCPPRGDERAAVVAANPAAPIELDSADERALAAGELAALVAAHNERARKLDTLESRASVEIRSRDADGEHFDQCEGDIFLAPGGKGALRLTKVGQNLAWIGSDGTRGWTFRLDAKPTSAVVYANERAGAFGGTDPIADQGGFRLLTPEAVRALAALAPIPSELALRVNAEAARELPAAERYEVEWRSPTGVRFAMRFGSNGKPTTVLARDEAGRELLRSKLADFVRARADDLAMGAWPELPRIIEIVTPDAGVSVKIFLGEPMARAQRMKPRFFELEALLAQLRPDSVEYIEAPASPEGVGDAPARAPLDAGTTPKASSS